MKALDPILQFIHIKSSSGTAILTTAVPEELALLRPSPVIIQKPYFIISYSSITFAASSVIFHIRFAAPSIIVAKFTFLNSVTKFWLRNKEKNTIAEHTAPTRYVMTIPLLHPSPVTIQNRYFIISYSYSSITFAASSEVQHVCSFCLKSSV